ncbi:MAG TPA: cytochrome P450 [Acidimicrobiia bacterium]|nr:cytochrome P450 [Acidimicrobiia bacterium]
MDRTHDEIDVSTLSFWQLTAEQRDERLAVLRAERPVSWQRPAEGMGTLPMTDDPGFWAVLTHPDVITVSRDPETYSSAQGFQIEDVPMPILEAAGSFLGMDHPRHTRLRRLATAAFTPRRIRAIEETIAARAARLVDDLLERGEGDFVDVLSRPMPSGIFAEMMGVDEEDRERVTQLADDMVAWNDPDALAGRDGITLLMVTTQGLHAAAQQLAEARRSKPADDLVTGLVTAEVDGERLTDYEIGSFFVLLSVAGNDTTRQTITHGMRALCQFPDERALLASDPDRYLPGAVEEMIRWATPVMTFRRTATRDTELNGAEIKTGDKVVMFYNSANRDEKVFPDPWRFDITREANHVGFGGGGPHFCLGASLARSMLRSTFRELVTRAPTLELGDPRFVIGYFIHGIGSIPYRVGGAAPHG